MTLFALSHRPSLFVLSALVAAAVACTSSNGGGGGGGDDDDSADDDSNGSSSGASSGSPGASSGSPGTSSSSGSSGTSGTAEPLPLTTFVYVKSVGADHDELVAWDYVSGEQRVLTDLTADGSDGWEIGGHAISPDRRSIALATLFEPTQADVDSQVAARRIFTVGSDGAGMKRLTPVWENKSAGRTNWMIEVRDPTWSKDGSDVFYSYGEYWYEGTSLQGGSAIWSVAASGNSLPTLPWDIPNCSSTDASTDPASGKVAVSQSICTDNTDGIWLYTPGGGAPERIVGGGEVSPSLEPVAWAADGSGFLFVGTKYVASDTVRGLFLYNATDKNVYDVVLPADSEQTVQDVAYAPSGEGAVYCMATGGASVTYDLHVLDFTKNPATDTQITNDGKSCSPRF